MTVVQMRQSLGRGVTLDIRRDDDEEGFFARVGAWYIEATRDGYLVVRSATTPQEVLRVPVGS